MEKLKKDIESILIKPGDLPPEHVAGEFILIADNDPILHNVGNAEFRATQWIGHIEEPAEMGGEVTFYQYPAQSLAEMFFTRLVNGLDGYPSEEIGDECVIHQGHLSFLPSAKSASIRFRRKRFVIEIRGWANDDPSFSRSTLTFEALVRYAKLLDQRLMAAGQ